MKILVTGGCGFIGTNFVLRMIAQHEIINLDTLTYAGRRENLQHLEGSGRYTFVHGDICNDALVDSLVKDVDLIVHFAAETHVDRSIENASDFVRTNVVGTRVLLDAAVRHKKRFHHISTDEVFGSLGPTGFFNETSPYDPKSPYAASKAASDHLVRAYHHTHGLKMTISNCSNNYGPYQFPEKIIPLFITNLLRGEKVPLYGNGENVRDWLHVEDHCDAIALIIEKGVIGETYCIGGGAQLSNLALAKQLLALMGAGEEMIAFVADRKGHDFRYAIDASKMHALGWSPRHTFAQGLAQTIAWYKEHEQWWRPLV